VLATGAHLLWRASASFALTPIAVLADGSYLAQLHPRRQADGPPITVRVIEYTSTAGDSAGEEESSEVFALVTDLLDIEAHPALDLAGAYPIRWEAETVIGHHKTDMGAGRSHGGDRLGCDGGADQIVHKRGRRVVGIDHIGSAHDQGQLGLLEETARQRLHADQQMLDLEMPTPGRAVPMPGRRWSRRPAR
jgi:hypothetical protein